METLETPGRLIVLEGIDDVGKSTIARHLSDRLRVAGRRPALYSFPGREPGTLGAHVYDLYHDSAGVGVRRVTPCALQLLVTAAHVDVIESRILPALQRGELVILDRYWWSTWVYGKAVGISSEFLRELVSLETMVWLSVKPAVAFLITRQATLATADKRSVRLQDLYSDLARDESTKYPVRVIRNDSTVADAAQLILNDLQRD